MLLSGMGLVGKRLEGKGGRSKAGIGQSEDTKIGMRATKESDDG